jgi:DNA-binding transcriptional MerR regulator
MSEQSNRKLMRSGELARLVGLSPDTLRHYERKGLLAPTRAENGYREYRKLQNDDANIRP